MEVQITREMVEDESQYDVSLFHKYLLVCYIYDAGQKLITWTCYNLHIFSLAADRIHK